MNSVVVKIAPELGYFVVIFLLFLQSAFGGNKNWPDVRSWLPIASLMVLLAAIYSLIKMPDIPQVLLEGTYTVDSLSAFFKLTIAAGFFIIVLNGIKQPTLPEKKRNDYYLFLTLSAWGLMLLCSTSELVSLFLALEISSYSLYILIPVRDDSCFAAEAGAKYILFGAAATAVSLFGLAFIMSSQHSTYISELSKMPWDWASSPVAVVGLSLFLCGMFYKLALFPFHFWCPDVYQGASNETAAYMATLPKLGAIIILIRFTAFLHPGMAITNGIAILGLISMTFGNICALVQKDIKRMLGFSSVAHAGYITLGLVVGTAQGLAAASFYAVSYIIMNLLCFWVISRIAIDGRNLRLSDLNGLHKRAPLLAFSLAIGAFALVGLPPTIGFMGKFFLMNAAWNNGYNWLVIAVAVNSAIAIYYYLNLVRHAYTEEDLNTPLPDISFVALAGATVLAFTALIFGILPESLYQMAVRAVTMM